MRSAIKLCVMSFTVFAVALATRRIFLWDVMPVSWDQEPPQTGALEAAFLLRSIENIAAAVAIIALAFAGGLFIRRWRRSSIP